MNAASRAFPLTIASDNATIHEHNNARSIENDIDSEQKVTTTSEARVTYWMQTEAIEQQETSSTQ